MDDIEFCAQLGIEVTVIEVWINEGWIRPETSEGSRAFRLADIARARLILDLSHHMGVNEAGVDIIMDLIDQIHGLRGVIESAISERGQPDDGPDPRVNQP